MSWRVVAAIIVSSLLFPSVAWGGVFEHTDSGP